MVRRNPAGPARSAAETGDDDDGTRGRSRIAEIGQQPAAQEWQRPRQGARRVLLDDATTLRPLGAIKGGWDTAHEPCVYVGHADLLQHTTRGCIDFQGKADYVVDPCGIEHPIEKSGCTFTCVPLTPKVAPNYETKLQLAGWRPDCEASAPYEGAIVQTDLPL